MKMKRVFSLLLVIMLGTGALTQSVYPVELTSGDELEEIPDGEPVCTLLTPDEVGDSISEEPAAVKPSDPAASIVVGPEEDATYAISEAEPFKVQVTGANSFGENAPVDGDTRWVFNTWWIDDLEEHTDHTDTGIKPVSEFTIHVSDGITISDYYYIHISLKQQMMLGGEWVPVEESGSYTITRVVYFELPTVTPPVHEGVDDTIQLEEGTTFIANLGLPYDHEVTPVIFDEEIVSIEKIERYTSEDYGDNKYLTRFTFKGLKAGATPVDVFDGNAVIWRYDITVTAKEDSGNGGSEITPTPTPRAPIIADINDTTVTGITNLKLMPNTYYPFTVTGAGTDNTNPVNGDTCWVPQYWRMESDPTQHANWRIGAKAGINKNTTIPIRVYLQEQRYNGSTGKWEATDVVDYITANVTAIPYDDPDELQQPKLIAAYNGAKGIGIKFYNVEEAEAYVIYRKFDGVWNNVCTVSADDPDLQINGNTIMYTDTSVAQNYGKGYIYSVAAKKGSKVTDFDHRGAAIYRLTPPALTKITNSANGTATVAWKGVFGKTETNGAYDLQYAEYKNGKAGEFKSVIARPGFNHQTFGTTVTGLEKGCRYVFRIRCSKTNKDRGTYYSEYSRWLSVTIEK